jgi:hypothetical protein
MSISCWWWSCQWGKTMSLNCGCQQADCSSPRWYMSMGNHSGMILRGETPDLSTRALWKFYQQSSSSKIGGNCNCFLRSISHTLNDSLTCRKISNLGLMALLPVRRKACCRMLLPLKILRPRLGLNPQALGPVPSTLTTRPLRKTKSASWCCLGK